ncbi:MAG: SDR family oxidoreductase [Hydrotalea sp.]|nr:SDR family oxidoreductase [Hydrotalea sp.]
MKKNILILGSGGMLGHIVNLHLRSFPKLFSVTDVARKSHILKPDFEFDISDINTLIKVYQIVKPDIIINCIGILNTNADSNPAEGIFVNAYLPHLLEKITSNSSCKVIHISTDCVFSGNRGGYYEDDFMDADGFYGRSKALGEIRNEKDLTIRTSIVGPELHTNGIGLFQWFSSQKGEILGYTEVFWTGVTTIELSNAIIHCIQEELTGLYHMVNDYKISKYDLLNIFKSVFNKSEVMNIVRSKRYSYDKSLINSRTDLVYKVPTYEFMIENMKSWILKHKEIYPHYHSIL